MTKVIIVDNKLYVPKNQALTSSFATDVVPICYNKETTKDDVLGAINGPISSIAFMYHNPGYEVMPFFQDITLFPGTNGPFYQPKYQYFNFTFIDIITSLRDRNTSGEKFIVDILTCDLKSQEFKDEVKRVEADLDIVIRYSVDKLGNSAEGGNWVLESAGVDIKDLYFTNGVLEWKGLLTSDITSAVKAGTYSAFITWNAGTNTYNVQQNFSWSSFISVPGGSGDVDSFITLGPGETFNGRRRIIAITGYNSWKGLFASTGTNVSRPTITNLGFINGRTEGGGVFTRDYQRNFIINNCYSTVNIDDGCGGITGRYNGSFIDITNCYSTGIIGRGAGGITGGFLMQGSPAGGICNITGCYSTGSIGVNAGGIAAANSNGISQTLNINNCYSTGFLDQNSGGMVGFYSGYATSGGININNCYSAGVNGPLDAGGIMGAAMLSTNLIRITNFVANGTRYTSGSPDQITNTNPSGTLDSINNTLYSGWSNTFWESATTSHLGRLLPIVKGFKIEPWDPSTYTSPINAAQFIPEALRYSYTILGDGTASFTGYSGGLLPPSSLNLMYISGSTTNGTLSSVPSASSYQITNIGASAFSNATPLTTIIAPFVTSVGASAFSGCSALANVYFGLTSGTVSFGANCFNNCNALYYVCKNGNNTSTWSASITTNVRTVLIKNYYPFIVSPVVSMGSSTNLTLTNNVQFGTVQDNAIVFTNSYRNIKNGVTIYSGSVNTPLSIAPNDQYSMSVSNTFETNTISGVGTGPSGDIGNNPAAITYYQFGFVTKRIVIGT